MKALKLLLSEPFERFQQYQKSTSDPYSSRSMDLEYHNNLACAYFGLGRVHYASSLFRKALNHSQSNPITLRHSKSVQYNLGLALMMSSKPAEALECFKDAIKAKKNEEWMTYLRMAECWIHISTNEVNSVKNSDQDNKFSFRIGQRIYLLDRRFQRLLVEAI
jgi:tetratricopeptide (TPR) repeat protein